MTSNMSQKFDFATSGVTNDHRAQPATVLLIGGSIYEWNSGGLALAEGEEGTSPEKQMFDKGMAIAGKGRFDEAIDWFQEIAKTAPESVYGWFGLAWS